MTSYRPARHSIAKYWCEQGKFVMDLGEPSCFACGMWNERWDRPQSIAERWNECGLEKAHIIAASENGSSLPKNFLLLCIRCHEDAPMTTNPEWMIQWAEQRDSWLVTFQREMLEEFARLGGTSQDLEILNGTCQTVLRDTLQRHAVRNHPGRGTRGISPSTAAVGLLIVAREAS